MKQDTPKIMLLGTITVMLLMIVVAELFTRI